MSVRPIFASLVYGLVDPRTGFVRYIGRSSHGLRRPEGHRYHLDEVNHKARWLRQLKAVGLEYGIVVLEIVSPEFLDDAECFWIAQAKGLGWPLTNVAVGGRSRSGWKQTAEARAKISAGNKGKVLRPETLAKLRGRILGPMSEATKRKLSEAKRGKPLSAEHRAKLKVVRLGHSVSPETRAKISAAHIGKVMSPETRAKISAVQKGKVRGPPSDVTRLKIGAAQKGRKFSEEHRAKMRAAWVLRKARSS